jgi:hypothetical protein
MQRAQLKEQVEELIEIMKKNQDVAVLVARTRGVKSGSGSPGLPRVIGRVRSKAC